MNNNSKMIKQYNFFLTKRKSQYSYFEYSRLTPMKFNMLFVSKSGINF